MNTPVLVTISKGETQQRFLALVLREADLPGFYIVQRVGTEERYTVHRHAIEVPAEKVKPQIIVQEPNNEH
jgi:hypothetical protein